MLIRLDEGTLREFPDDLAALILADPSCGDDVAEFSVDDVNLLVHAVFGTLYDSTMSYEDNLRKARNACHMLGAPSEKTYQAALAAVRLYNQHIASDKIGAVSHEEASQLFCSGSPTKTTKLIPK